MIIPKLGDQIKFKEQIFCPRCECKYENRNTTIIKVNYFTNARIFILNKSNDLFEFHIVSDCCDHCDLGNLFTCDLYALPHLLGSIVEQENTQSYGKWWLSGAQQRGGELSVFEKK